MKLLDTIETLFPPEVAEHMAAKLKLGDPDWSYVVKHDPKGNGMSYIEVYDEEGELVSKY
jgi:hypothetical protein